VKNLVRNITTTVLIFITPHCIIIPIEGGYINKYYVEIDAVKFEQAGEVALTSPPMPWQKIFDDNLIVPKGNFGIHRLDWLCTFIESVGGQRGKVAVFLIRKKDGQNKVLASNREIAAQTGVALSTANSFLQDLRDTGCIKCRTAAVMLNPGVAHKGNREREAYLLKLYAAFGNQQSNIHSV